MTDHPATNHTHHPEASAAAHDHPRRFSPALAHRLEAPERKLWLPIEPVLAQMDLAPGIAVADIGVGTGYFALPIAQAIGGSGRVAAVGEGRWPDLAEPGTVGEGSGQVPQRRHGLRR